MKSAKLFLVLFGLSLNTFLFAQVDRSDSLFIQLKAADSLLFDLGFNLCDSITLQGLIHQDLVFFHDQGGMSDRDAFFQAVKQNICANPDLKPIRKLKENSLEVYPLYNNGRLYGAIQKGEHEFFLAAPGKDLRFTSMAKFTHTWILEEGRWQVHHVLSYDHQSPEGR